ncbi:PAX3- and PAX7-binding protein 1 [Agrilus planipennis]|uniref:PAX3- and PAX7-binding protein 1 n=1 Tax=Agrilus planipennis TaxID=224129 RepID=A0A1W4WHL7_AGRPL|nr:PAX3- and PAX7-binding protein 1 [Agrilus planipennis]XP_018323424.1 PAX3- and PAX7-binding protein 1 [Agrilus planipennis]XP_018323425.1 PAX3- and PAX7-binding protein 1 [Agrilus planipennis]XP_018323426.1 PAX3- and PAX7-binding protein 1 [Agrilus planipennis]XP_018323427.1 PAX3- and PAX7-binding protein 1 [Agrilus planipennis]XP_018323428.1 PAX3- and PAX7-binding protein 1 [Agrilus planipennis]XP_025834693.1 PAX3- and PAX7-binding protein 1 [Agrilus planipennis]
MSLFRKPKKHIQRRVFTENDEDDEDIMDVEIPAEKDTKKKDKNKLSSKKKQPLLSFETEEEGEVFQVKKSSHSRKIMKLFEKEKHKKKDKTEKEEVKQKEVVTEIITDDLIMKVNPSHKINSILPEPPPPPILSGRDALCAGKDDLSSEEEESNSAHKFSKPDNFKKVLESGAIPDAAMIHAARKRRQRARELGGDYLPIEDDEVKEDTGRLIRDDEHDASEDEERIDMDINPLRRDQDRRREQFLAAQESEEEADQEIDEWENQQIRKGVTGAPMAVMSQEYIYDNNYTTTVQSAAPPVSSFAFDSNIQVTPEAIVDKLRTHYQTLSTSRDAHAVKLQKVSNRLVEANEELEEQKKRAPVAAERFRFYQELRGYVTDLVECFDEKVALIADLEQRSIDLMARKAIWLIERRRQDVRDQAEEATLAYKPNLVRKNVEDEEKTRRAAEREGRRTRRRRAREQGGQQKHVEGMSSDDEISQQDMLGFDKDREQMELEIQAVLEDVIDDFSSIANILIKFEQWKETDVTAYNEAYGTLCLPRIVTPLIRLDLLFWDPLTESMELEKLDWYRTLALYGLHDNETENDLNKDPDVSLLPKVIDKVVVPKLTQLVDRCWDPLSSSQTLRLVGTISRYIRRFPTLGPASKSLQNLFNAILHKLKEALEHDVFIPIVPKFAETKMPFFQRQFASGLKLLRNITSWQGILNDNTLKDLALNSLLNRYLLSAIKICQLTDAVNKMGLISHILPRIWLQNNTIHLEMFSMCVTNLGQQLDKNNPLHLESIETLSNIIKSLRN